MSSGPQEPFFLINIENSQARISTKKTHSLARDHFGVGVSSQEF